MSVVDCAKIEVCPWESNFQKFAPEVGLTGWDMTKSDVASPDFQTLHWSDIPAESDSMPPWTETVGPPTRSVSVIASASEKRNGKGGNNARESKRAMALAWIRREMRAATQVESYRSRHRPDSFWKLAPDRAAKAAMESRTVFESSPIGRLSRKKKFPAESDRKIHNDTRLTTPGSDRGMGWAVDFVLSSATRIRRTMGSEMIWASRRWRFSPSPV